MNEEHSKRMKRKQQQKIRGKLNPHNHVTCTTTICFIFILAAVCSRALSLCLYIYIRAHQHNVLQPRLIRTVFQFLFFPFFCVRSKSIQIHSTSAYRVLISLSRFIDAIARFSGFYFLLCNPIHCVLEILASCCVFRMNYAY